MEPAPTKVRYVINSTVRECYQEKGLWFLHINGSWEALSLGSEEPDFVAGDTVRITIERIL